MLNVSVRRAGIVVLRSDVEQQDVLDLALEYRSLDGGAQGDDLVRVDRHVGVLAAGEPADKALHRGDPGGAADEDHLVDVVRGELGVRHRLLYGTHAAFDQVGGDLLEGRPHQRRVEVLGPVGVRGDERQVHGRLGDRGELYLGLLRGLEQPLQRLRVAAEVDAFVALELVREVVDDAAVEVVAAQVPVA